MEKNFKTMGLYLGRFSPMHRGHLYIRDKASEILDMVKLVRIFESNKRSDYYPPSKLIDIQYSLNIINLITEFEKNWKVVVVRGIRNEMDYYKERIFFDQLKLEKPNLKIMYIFSTEEFKNLSSSWIKRLPTEDQKKYIM